MARFLPIFAATIATIALAACHRDEEVREAGPQTQRDYPVGDFTSIEVAGPYDVKVATGGKPSVHVTGPANMLQELVVEVERGELRIHPKSRHGFNSISWQKHGPITVEVSAPSLNEATIAGSGDISIDKVAGDSFEGTVAGSGSLALAGVDVQRLELSIAGSGGVSGSGKAASAKHSIAGSGSITAPGIVSRDVEISIAGSGDVATQATGTAKVTIMGSGDVTITGGAKCEIQKLGSGNVSCS